MSEYLVPLDGSNVSEKALVWARLLAEKHNSSLRLLRCYHPLASVYSFQDFATPEPIAYDLSGFIRHCEKYLESLAKKETLPTEWSVKEGSAAEEILKASESSDCEAIVMASQGKGGIQRWLLGSEVQKVLRASNKSVFVIRPEQEKTPALDTIVVGMDGSDFADKALEEAAKLAERFGSKLVLFKAINYAPYPLVDVQTVLEHEESLAVQALQEKKEKYPHLEIQVEVRCGYATLGLLEMCEETGCDLLVLGSHGTSGFERFVLGSITEKMLHKGTTPLLIVYKSESEQNS